jgi:hypothetical protein
MNKEQIQKQLQEVDEAFDSIKEKENRQDYPIYDGIVDIDRYLSVSPKILWILKEPYDDFDKDGKPCGGSWSITEDVFACAEKSGNKPPFATIAYVTYSVFNNFVKYSEMDYVTEDPRIWEALKNIAYINVNKFPGKKRSDSEIIASYYQKNRELLKNQIDAINPDIVIAGNILYLFYEDFDLTKLDLKSGGPGKSAEFCQKDGRLFINAYHPSYWGIKPSKYVDDLVAIIKEHSLVNHSTKL